MLESPSGARVSILNRRGADAPFTGTLTFDDESVNAPLLATVAFTSGTYQPSGDGNTDSFPTLGTGPWATSLSAFDGTAASGQWKLYIIDPLGGDSGSLAGWSLNITSSLITINPSTLPTLTAGTAFSQTLTSTGGGAPYSYSRISGTLPAGLSLSPAGVLSGTPTQRGGYSFTVQSQDANSDTGTRAYSGTVQNPSLLISPASATAIQGIPLSQTLTASGGVAPHSFLRETGSFPAGISISSAGVVSGTTAAAPGNYPVTLRVTDASTGAGSYFELESFTVSVSPAPSVSISVAPSSVAENGASNLVYTVTRSLNLVSPTVVNITTAGTAASGTDYTGGVSSVIIPGGSTSATITVNPTGDVTFEPDETVTLIIAAGTGYTVGAPSSATGTILNDDAPPVTISPSALPNGTIATAYNQTISASGATAPYSFAVSAGALPAGLTLTAGGVLSGMPSAGGSYNFTIAATDSSAAPGPYSGARAYTLVVNAPTIMLPATTLADGTVGAPYSAAIDPASGGTAPYAYAVTNGALPGGLSLNAATGAITGTPSASGTFSFSITAIDSSTGSGPYSATRGYSIVVSAGPSISIALSPASVLEDGASNLVYTVTRSQSLPIANTVNITTSGTASSGVDYSGGVSTVTIAANATTATITIDPSVDGTVEADETVILSVATGTGYTVGTPASATGTILNDDVPAASITVAPAAVQEDGAANLIYTVTLDQAAFSPTSLNFTLGGTAASGSDYAAVTSPLLIPIGNTTGTITVNPIADTAIEPDETVILSLAVGSGYTVGLPSSATGMILNDDLPNLSINDVTTSEGNAGNTNFTFTVSLSAPAGAGGVTFNIATANGTAIAGTDYVAQSLAGQTIASGSDTYSFTVLVNGDTLNEANETFFLNVFNVVGANVVDGQGLGTIVNDDALPSLSINDVSVTEGNSGITNAAFTVTLSAASGQSVSVNYATADGTATQPADYTSTSGTLTFTPGQTTRTITVAVNGDTTPEANETYFVNLSGAVNATIADNEGVGTILNDDSPSASISVAPASVLEDGAANLVYTVSLSVPAITATTVNLSTAGTATSGSDYSGAVSSVLIPANASNATLTIDPTADEGVEADETVIISVLAGTDYTVGIPSSATGTISNDDVRGISVVQSGGNTAVAEGGATDSFTLVLTSQPEANVQIALDGGAQVTAAPTPLTFTAANWNVAQAVTVTAINDALFENDPHPGSVSFTVTSSEAGYSAFAVPAVAVSVTDNDPAPTISISSPSLPEGNSGTSVMNFVISLSAPSALPVTFTRATADGTATVASNDYVALPAAAANIPAGQQALTIPVTINGDTVFEGDETFALVLTAITNATPSSTISGTGTITEDDQQPTTTAISSDLPDPSVVGQPYTVVVNVAANSSSPLGTVTISDGTASCGPITLVAGTSPNSTASCDVTSTSVGAKTLTATYTPASTAFAAGTATTAHQVNAAATTISVTGPARSRINQPVSFSFALAVTAPGGGTPTGTVTLSSGASSCVAMLPSTSCSLSFSTLGSPTISASYAATANYSASTSSGAGNAQTLVFALADLQVSKTDGVDSYGPDDLLVYTVQLRNLGPDAASNLRLRDTLPAALPNVLWSCDSSGGTSCPQSSGSGDLDALIAVFPVGGLLNYTFYANVQGSPPQLVNTALVELPADTTIEDPVLSNNSATDINRQPQIFANGFEELAITASSGSYRMPSLALRDVLDGVGRASLVLNDAEGDALRVYARVWDGEVQYALASRDSSGALKLAAWRAYDGEPLLSWTVRSLDSGGWVIENVEFRREQMPGATAGRPEVLKFNR